MISLLATLHQRVIAPILYSAMLLAPSLHISGLRDVAGEVRGWIFFWSVLTVRYPPVSIVASTLGMVDKVDSAIHFSKWRG